MGMVVTSGSLWGVMISTLAWNVKDVGSIPALGTMFPNFAKFHTLKLSDGKPLYTQNVGIIFVKVLQGARGKQSQHQKSDRLLVYNSNHSSVHN